MSPQEKWERLRRWSMSIDEKDDISDEARRWADDECAFEVYPSAAGDVGGLKVLLSIAFEAGRRFGRAPGSRCAVCSAEADEDGQIVHAPTPHRELADRLGASDPSAQYVTTYVISGAAREPGGMVAAVAMAETALRNAQPTAALVPRCKHCDAPLGTRHDRICAVAQGAPPGFPNEYIVTAEWCDAERTNADRIIPEPASNVCPGCGGALGCLEKTHSCKLGEGCRCGASLS